MGSEETLLVTYGGDDFVAVTSSQNVEQICIKITKEFDKRILEYISEEDKERGVFEVPNRKGIIEQFPLTSISVAVVKIEEGQRTDSLIIAEVGAQIKHKVKTMPGSAYYIGQRLV